MDAWNRLELIETPEILHRLYKKRHGRSPNKDKSQEIVANLIQGRRYFESGENTDVTIRPLLFYYGILSISRALILFLKKELRETSLNSGHGLSIIGDSDLNDKNWPLGLSAKVTNGTFTKLAYATHSKIRLKKLDIETNELFVESETLKDSDRLYGEISLDDALSRYQPTIEVYQEVLERPGNLFRGLYWTKTASFQNIEWIENKDFKQLFEIHENVPIRRIGNNISLVDSKYKYLGKDQFIPFQVEGGHNPGIAIPPITNFSRKFLDEVSLLFSISFFLGMACRYYPSKWMNLTSRGQGSLAYPVLNHAINSTSKYFPEFAVSFFENKKMPELWWPIYFP